MLRHRFPPNEQIRITNHPKPVGEVSTTVTISRQIDPNRALYLIKAFNKGLKILKQNGRYQELLSQYQP